VLSCDADRAQAFLFAPDGDGLGGSTTEEGHAAMICAPRTFSCSRALRGALEALFGACPANDLLALSEAETSLLHAQCLPQLLEARVEILDLVLYR